MIRINLLPTKQAQKVESVVAQLVVFAVVVVVALVACFFVNRSVQKKIDEQNLAISDLNAQIKQLQGVIAEVEEYKKKQRDLNRKIDTIKNLNNQRTGPVKLMEEFTYVLPRKAWITVFRENGKQLTLEGMAMDGPTVSDFIDSLRASKFFQGVQLIQTQQTPHAGKKAVKFNINCRVNYSPRGGKKA